MKRIKMALYRFANRYGFVSLLLPAAMLALFVNLTRQVNASTDAVRIAYWHLDETAGPPYVDAVGGHDGLCAASCPTADSTGQINGGQAFDGLSSGITIAADDAFNWGVADSFSVEFWVKAVPGQTCSSSDQVLVGRADSGAGSGYWSLGCTAVTGTVNFQLGDSSGFSTTLESSKVITTGVWHHVAGVYDGTTGTKYLYVDGTVVSATHTFSGSFAPTAADLSLGYMESGVYFEGTLDEVALYTGVLSAEAVQTDYYLSRQYAGACAAPVRIMPLGDSVTRGGSLNPVVGYRQPLYLSLVDANYDVDFVGSEKTGFSAVPSFDVDHEGHSGFTDDEVGAEVYNWLQSRPADVVLLHIGTNDLFPETMDNTPDDVAFILDEIDRYDEAITVILARIINRTDDGTDPADTTQFNADVAAMAEARIAAGDKIIIVDQESALTYPDDLVDGVHPTSAGYGKMANVWLAALNDFMPACTAVPPTITSIPLTEVGIDETYNYTVTATGNPSPTYGLVTAPGGMDIVSNTGGVTWIPDAGGVYSVTVEANNIAGTDTQGFYLTVTAAPTITSVPLTQIGVNELYNYDVEAAGFPTPTYDLAVSPGTMTIVTDTGAISWLPTAAGIFSVSVVASNDVDSAAQDFDITVTADPTITSSPPTEIGLGQSYSYDVEATGFPTPTYALIQAPGDMTIMTDTGEIAWTPASSGLFSVTVAASNIAAEDRQGFYLTVTEIPAITTSPVTEIGKDQLYTYDVDASGYPTPTYNLVNPPAGMTIITETGAITWTPDTSGVFSVTVQASNATGDDVQSFDLIVTEAPAIVSTAVTEIAVGQSYNYDVDATGYPTPTYSLVSAPAGMTIITATGEIAWTPVTAGEFAVSVAAENVVGTAVQNFTITVTQAVVIISTPVTTVGVDEAYSYDVDATGHPTPTYTLLTKPAGMEIDPVTGLISWAPGTTGVFSVTVQASNAASAGSQDYDVSVTQTPIITSTPVEEVAIHQTYSYAVQATGYPMPTFALISAPAGMTIDTDTGLITWMPQVAGEFAVTVEARNAVGSIRQNLTVLVMETPQITSVPVIDVKIGQPYHYLVTATGYPTPTYSLTDKPDGMVIDADTGLITWTPPEDGLFAVAVVAESAAGTAVQRFDVTASLFTVYLPVIVR